jgi:rubrerythrin
MKESVEIGMNRTGIQTSPKQSEAMKKASEEQRVDSIASEDPFKKTRTEYIREGHLIGSVPVPSTFKGLMKSGAQVLKQNRPQVFIDRLGERLAFERTGVRLYSAFITKCEESSEDLPVEEFRRFRSEELEHFEMLKKALEKLGADPTAETPAADVAGVASMGVMKVITDPRTTPIQSLEAILIAELVDHDGWELLIALADEIGEDKLAENFRTALDQEEEHLETIRQLVKDNTLDQGGSLLQ